MIRIKSTSNEAIEPVVFMTREEINAILRKEAVLMLRNISFVLEFFLFIKEFLEMLI